jgi:site-specific DNA-adenine methylase
MWSYYGSKSKIVGSYPRPMYDKIIEPFAGTARYSLKYFDRNILLIDKYKVIIDIWHYLQQASKNDILNLPKLKQGDNTKNYKFLSDVESSFLGFVIAGGSSTPQYQVGTFRGIGVERDLKRISEQLYKIKHWEIKLGDYKDIHNQESTWFIDPPYQWGGEYYKISNKELDFKELGEWCKSRLGQSIVCENTKADWLPFLPMRKLNGSIHRTTEAIWSNRTHGFELRQADMFVSSPPPSKEQDTLK